MSKPVIFIKDENNRYRAVIDVIPDWDGFDKLIRYLEINYQTKILKSYDGPDARRWVIEVDGVIIELIHSDDYGNYLVAPTEESESLVYKIGKDLENRLKNIDD